MGKYVVLIGCILLCAGYVCVRAEKSSEITDPYKDMYGKVVAAGLPGYGVVIHDSLNPQKWYYYVNFMRLKYISNHKKGDPILLGLWGSDNNGDDWRRRSSFSDFYQVLVHPGSSLLYAIICDETFYETDSGFLDSRVGYKIIVSKEGYNWTDITPGGEYIYRDIFRIYPDPHSEKGVCVYQQTDGLMWQTSGEEPISWKKYTMEEWVDQHPDWTFEDMFPSGTLGKGVLMEGEKLVEDPEK